MVENLLLLEVAVHSLCPLVCFIDMHHTIAHALKWHYSYVNERKPIVLFAVGSFHQYVQVHCDTKKQDEVELHLAPKCESYVSLGHNST